MAASHTGNILPGSVLYPRHPAPVGWTRVNHLDCITPVDPGSHPLPARIVQIAFVIIICTRTGNCGRATQLIAPTPGQGLSSTQCLLIARHIEMIRCSDITHIICGTLMADLNRVTVSVIIKRSSVLLILIRVWINHSRRTVNSNAGIRIFATCCANQLVQAL